MSVRTNGNVSKYLIVRHLETCKIMGGWKHKATSKIWGKYICFINRGYQVPVNVLVITFFDRKRCHIFFNFKFLIFTYFVIFFNKYILSDGNNISLRRHYWFVVFNHYVWSISFYIAVRMNGKKKLLLLLLLSLLLLMMMMFMLEFYVSICRQANLFTFISILSERSTDMIESWHGQLFPNSGPNEIWNTIRSVILIQKNSK